MKRVAAPLLVVTVLLAGASVGTLLAADEKAASDEKKKEAKAPKKEAPPAAPVSPIYQAAQKSAKGEPVDETAVITNSDLEKMWAGLSPSERLQGVYQAERHIGSQAPGQAAAPSDKPDATQQLEGERAAAAKSGEARAETQKNVDELRAKVDELDRRLLALRNPLLPRRYAERKDEESKDWDTLSNPERVARTEEELKKAKEDLAAAERELGRQASAPR